MSANSAFARIRQAADVSQATMAMAMEVPLRTYEDIEAGRSTVRPIHVSALKFALMRLADARDDASLLSLDPEVERLTRDNGRRLEAAKP